MSNISTFINTYKLYHPNTKETAILDLARALNRNKIDILKTFEMPSNNFARLVMKHWEYTFSEYLVDFKRAYPVVKLGRDEDGNSIIEWNPLELAMNEVVTYKN